VVLIPILCKVLIIVLLSIGKGKVWRRESVYIFILSLKLGISLNVLIENFHCKITLY